MEMIIFQGDFMLPMYIVGYRNSLHRRQEAA